MAASKQIFDMEVTRKEFLTYIAMSLLALFGVKDFLTVIFGHKPARSLHGKESDTSDGFGASKFGV